MSLILVFFYLCGNFKFFFTCENCLKNSKNNNFKRSNFNHYLFNFIMITYHNFEYEKNINNWVHNYI